MNIQKQVLPQGWPANLTTGRTLTLDVTEAILGLLAAYALSVVAMALARVLPSVLVVPFVVLSLSFVPGTLLLLAFANRDHVLQAQDVLYAFGGSLILLMFVGAIINISLPVVGVARPLMPVPLGAGVTVTVGGTAALARWRNSAGTVTLEIPPLWSPTPLGLFLLPLLSIIGVSLINATGVALLLIAVLVAAGTVPLLTVHRLDDRWHSLAIWTVALAILYHKSLWQYSGFGGRPHGITAWEAGRWSPGIASIEPYSSELLQNGVLFPLFARLSDLFIMTQYEVVNPFFVSFIPLALYVTFRRYVPTSMAFLGAATFAFAHPFYLQYPTAGRAATPVLFLALFGVTLSNRGLSSGARGMLGVSFLAGIVVTHYGTSYYVAAGFAAAMVILYLLRLTDVLIGDRFRRAVTVPDGGTSTVGGSNNLDSQPLFSSATVAFFISAALGWYLYTRQGWKFDLLPKHIYENFVSLVSGPEVSGRTTARVQESYASSPSIQLGKYLYILLAVLIALGFVVVYYRRVVTSENSFDDQYLAIATALFGIFGTTLILRNWGGGRPMMITFSFTTIFAIIGASWLVDLIKRLLALTNESLSSLSGFPAATDRQLFSDQLTGVNLFAGLLMILLVLNTGVASATIYPGSAPSNVPAQSDLTAEQNPGSQVTVHRQSDIATHVWVVQHLDSSYTVYGDTFAARQFDWYRPDIAAQTQAVGGGYTRETKPEPFDLERQRIGAQPGYLLIMGHNLELNAVWPTKFGAPSDLEDLATDERNRIYTTGESHVYFHAEPQQAPVESDGADNE
jgi:uncharacterized membrane protein